nr:P6 protein [Barley yellow dwarf virus PAV]
MDDLRVIALCALSSTILFTIALVSSWCASCCKFIDAACSV